MLKNKVFTKKKVNLDKPIVEILVMFLVAKLMLYVLCYLGDNLFAGYLQPPIYQNLSPDSVVLNLPGSLLATHLPTFDDFTKFDARWYLEIAKNGYDKIPISSQHLPANWVFFPLFPLLVRWLHIITSLDYGVIGVLLSNVLFLASLIIIYFIAKERAMNSEKVRMLILFILIYPASLYYSVPYTESLFLLLSALTLYFTDKKNYKSALICAGLSSVTRIPGFLNLLYVISLIVIDKRLNFRKRDLSLLLYFGLALLPMTMFLAFMHFLTGDFLAPLHEQGISWNRTTTFPFTNYILYIFQPYFIASGGWDNGLISFAVATAVLFIFLLYFISRFSKLKNPKDLVFFLYGFALIVVPFSSSNDDLTSVIRYMMVSIPFYFYLVVLANRHFSLRIIYLFMFFALNILTIIAYANYYRFIV